MKFERKLSEERRHPEDMIQWKTIPIKLAPTDVEPIQAEVPAYWSDTAAQIIVTKYFRKAGVPQHSCPYIEETVPSWLHRAVVPEDVENSFGSETSAKQVFHRIAGALTYHGWKMGLFTQEEDIKELYQDGIKETYRTKNSEKNAHIFYDELYLILAKQLAAPNSPQWFNTGLWWAYGIEGPVSGQWAVDWDISGNNEPALFETENAYERPQPHACFIQPVNDDLVNPGGIMDLWTREVRLFKQGSGTGSNFSNIRGKGEPLSGGGVSSGVMSFLEIGDRAAGAISSGGVTRRAAKMVILDADHPEIEDFIDWKVREEQKAAAMWIGSNMLRDPMFRNFLSNHGLLPMAIEDQLAAGIQIGEFDIGYEGEAIRTVGGQNANNTVRVTDEFMQKIKDNDIWWLANRTDPSLGSYRNVGDLWNHILRAAWASADPGLQFHDTINRWHTCKTDGEIRASNPCSEYMFLDNTACNLASLNLARFYALKNLADPTSYKFDVDLFCHVARLMTVVLDISVSMASFPSREIALGSYNYRTLGLGYANLGGLLMRMGLPYDSHKGRSVASEITALMTAMAYATSANLANELGTFPKWEANKDSMREVVEMHVQEASKLERTAISDTANHAWDLVRNCKTGFRNAQVTLLAPTGTIGLLMDCDTLGIEPDFSLVKHKSLAGGGAMVLVNESVHQALIKLGYKTHAVNLIRAYIKQHGTVEGCPDVQPGHLPVFDCATPPQGFRRSIAPMGHVNMMAAVQPFLSGAISKTVNMPNSATVEDVGEVYMAAWKLGLKAVAIYRDGSKLAQPLQTKVREIPQQLKETGHQIEFEEFIPPVREKDGKVTLDNYPKHGMTTEFEGRLVPRQQIDSSEPQLHELDFEATESFTKTFEDHQKEWVDITGNVRKTKSGTMTIPPQAILVDKDEMQRGVREYLPWRRESVFTQKVNLNGQSIHITIGRYPDGRPGEVRLELSRVGTTLDAMTNMVAMMISIGLQYGVPVEEYVKRLSGRKFEPAGLVEGHDQIKHALSIADLIAKELGITFLGRSEMGEVSSELSEGAITQDMVKELHVTVGAMARHPVAFKPHLDICPSCHEPTLTRNGSCMMCTNGSCGYTEGCGG